MKPSLKTRLKLVGRALSGRDWAGAQTHRLLLDWIAWTRSADAEIRGSIRKMRARARELCRDEAAAKHYLRLLVINVLGPNGFKMQARVRRTNGEFDEEINTTIEEGWKDYSQHAVSVDGRQNLRQFAAIGLKTLARDGECIIRLWFGFERNRHGLALQFLDPDLLDETFNRPAGTNQNEVRMGVEVDSFGAPVAYHFWTGHPDDMTLGRRRLERVAASEILHIYDADRPNQTRGMTWFHAAMVPIHMLGGYEEAELVASRAAAAKMGFLRNREGAEVGLEETTLPATMEAQPGTLEDIGDKVFEAWDPQHPVTAFPDFVRAVARKISTAVGAIYNQLFGDWSDVNYNSLRAAFLDGRDIWRCIQSDWRDSFYQPIYEAWVGMALVHGTLRLPSLAPQRYYNVAWRPRGWSWVDPKKEGEANALAMDYKMKSLMQIMGENGDDVEDVFDEIEYVQKLAKRRGIELAPPQKSPPTNGSGADPAGDDEDDDEDGARAVSRLNGRNR